MEISEKIPEKIGKYLKMYLDHLRDQPFLIYCSFPLGRFAAEMTLIGSFSAVYQIFFYIS